MWPCGLMDKASDFESEDCRFDPCQGRFDFYNFGQRSKYKISVTLILNPKGCYSLGCIHCRLRRIEPDVALSDMEGLLCANKVCLHSSVARALV